MVGGVCVGYQVFYIQKDAPYVHRVGVSAIHLGQEPGNQHRMCLPAIT